MRTPSARACGIVCAVVAGCAALAGCGGADKSNGKSSGASTSGSSSAPSAASSARPAAGAPGAGDKSGKDVANAMPLAAGKPAEATLDCKQSSYWGPFAFHGQKDKLVVHVEIKPETETQACLGGDWQSGKGQFLGVVTAGCAEGGKPVKTDVAVEYDPGAGGLAENPVYLRLGFEEATCSKVKVTLSVP